MNANDTIKAWKNKSFRAGLSASQLEQLPANPAGVQDLDVAKLEQVSGGIAPKNTVANCLITMVGCPR